MKFRCPQCSQKLEGDRSFGGRDIECPTCHCQFTIAAFQEDDTRVITPPGTPAHSAELDFEKDYTFRGQIARGGMGKIISATDNKLDRSVVVKQLLDPNEDPVLVNQLIREAQITARLSHPGIVPIHELGRDSRGRIYYTMKHIRGEPLDQVLDKLREGDPEMIGKCPFERLLLIFTRVCDTIGYANEMGIVHRDIKPDNIMLAPYGEYLVIDWGIAKDLNDKSDGEKNRIVSAYRYTPEKGEFGATLHGAVFGSPSYMSPEQARGDVGAIDARSDVFGLGALLFEMLTLSTPYEGEDPEEVVKLAAGRKIQRISTIRKSRPDPLNPWPHLQGGDLPNSVLAVAMKAMRMNPDDRYQTADELRSDIESYLAGYTTEAENAGFFKIVRLAINRNRSVATALAAGAILAGTAVSVTASLNRAETQNARQARIEAERYVAQANEARAQRRQTRFEVAPSYVEMARLLANRGDEANALVVANLAAKYDPHLVEATALVKALEVYVTVNKGTPPPLAAKVGNRPSLAYLLENPDELKTTPGNYISEQTYTRLELAYSEVGLSRFSGELSAQQIIRVDRYRHDLEAAWKDCDLDWDLSLAPELSSLCLEEELKNSFTDYSRWASQIDRTYPGQVLHLDIRRGNLIPDLSILSNLAIESLVFGEAADFTGDQIRAISNCRSLKVISIKGGSFSDLSFLKGLPLVSIQIDNESPEMDVSSLNDCETLQVFSAGKLCRLTALPSLPGGKLHFFSGCAEDGDYRSLSRMPLQLLAIRNGDPSIELESLKSLSVQTLIAEGIDLQKNWDTVAAWPLKFLSIDSDIEIDASALRKSVPRLSDLYLLDGQWTGDASRVFPGLEHLVDRTGRSFECFTAIEQLETIRIEGNGKSISYLSALEKVPLEKDLQLRHDLSVQVLPEAVALSMVKGDWDSARIGCTKIQRKVQRRPDLTPASLWVNQLEEVISNRDDSDEVFVSRKFSHGKSVYQAVFCGLTRERAEWFAENVGGSLPVIENQAELDFLMAISLSHPEYGAFWIGNCSALNGESEIPGTEAPVLPAHRQGKMTRAQTCLYPFIIEWKDDAD